MKGRNFIVGVLFLVLWGGLPIRASAAILIHEILADPPTGLAGDANGDGVSSSGDDEFVEFFNSNDGAMDISGWSLRDALRVRHIFPNATILPARSLFVVFGGGNPNLAGVSWQTASTGALSLNNSNETITLSGVGGELIDQIFYGVEGGNDQSLVRSPEATSSPFILHTALEGAHGRRYSPGEFINAPAPVSVPAPSAVPEAATIYYFTTGVLSFYAFGKKRGII